MGKFEVKLHAIFASAVEPGKLPATRSGLCCISTLSWVDPRFASDAVVKRKPLPQLEYQHRSYSAYTCHYID
jgi:hypothetical protein